MQRLWMVTLLTSLVLAASPCPGQTRQVDPTFKEIERLMKLAQAAEPEVAKLREAKSAIAGLQTLPADPNRPGLMDWTQKSIDFRMLEVATYQKRAKEATATRQAIEKLLTQLFTDTTRGTLNTMQIEEDANNVLALGAKDPIVLAYIQLAKPFPTEPAEVQQRVAATESLLKKVPALDRGLPYEVLLRRELLLADLTLSNGSPGAPPPKQLAHRRELATSVLKYLERAVRRDDWSVTWAYLAKILSPLTSETSDTAKFIHQEIVKAPKVPDWYKLNAAISLLTTQGWEARGNGVAGTVTDQGWKELKAKLTQARRLALLAWTMQPDSPVPPNQMLALVAVGAEDEWGKREWFQVSVDAQFDYLPAYELYFTYVAREWGGSDELQIRFASECLASGRVDTQVPVRGLAFLDQRYAALKLSRSLWDTPDAGKALRTFVEKYIAADEASSPIVYIEEQWSDQILIWLVEAGHYSLAQTWSKRGTTEAEGIAEIGTRPDRMEQQIAAGTGPGAKVAIPLMVALCGTNVPGNLPELRSQLAELRKLDPSEPTGKLCDEMAAVLSQYEGFEKGEWLDLKFSGDLPGWRMSTPGWTRVDDQTITVTGENNTFLYPVARFRPPYQMEVDVQVFDPSKQIFNGVGSLIGGVETHFFPFSKTQPVTLVVSPNLLEAAASYSRDKRTPVSTFPSGGSRHLSMKVVSGSVNCTVDGVNVGDLTIPNETYSRIAIGLTLPSPQPAGCRFHRFRIQKLTPP